MKRIFSILFISILVFLSACNIVDGITGNNDDDHDVDLFPVLVDGEYGYINTDGTMVIEPQLQIAYPFNDGLAAVRDSWRWKYMNSKGEFVIEGSFQEIKTFSEGKAAVRMDGRWGFINKKGDFIINPRFRSAKSYSDGRAFVRSLDYSEYLYIDDKGNKIESINMPDDLDNIDNNEFYNGRALVSDNNLLGYIDRTGNTIVDLKYSEALPFSDNLAAVKVSDRWGFIDSNGEVKISPQFISAGKFGNGLAPARKNSNQFGYVDKTGAFVISEQFDEVREFTEERAPVFVNGKWTFIDKTGTQITAPKFDEVAPFYNGLALVTIFVPVGDEVVEQYGYINKDGNYVWFPTN